MTHGDPCAWRDERYMSPPPPMLPSWTSRRNARVVVVSMIFVSCFLYENIVIIGTGGGRAHQLPFGLDSCCVLGLINLSWESLKVDRTRWTAI